MEKEMKELHIEGLATRDDPESCVGTRESAGEALTGAHVGRAIEPRNARFGVPTSCRWRKATPPAALSRATGGPRAVEEPVHAWNLYAREPGAPVLVRPGDHRTDRPGKAEAVRLG